MDGNTSPTIECKVYIGKDCTKQYDASQSGPDKSVFTCACGQSETIYEDCGTGA